MPERPLPHPSAPGAPPGPARRARDPWPPRPRADTPAELGFVRRRMVDWLSPTQLAATGLRATMSEVFGAYADKREMEAVMAVEVDHHDYSHHRELWFDHVADLGDGFAPTYAVAWLLSRPELAPAGAAHPLPRGRFLVMGGDQVYPTASEANYRDRLVGPYKAALPYVAVDPPHLYAIPGNHDWYDGLTSFLRLFCQGDAGGRHRWIGGWQIRQKRSYFALKLPAGWWLWGIDMQLGSGFDRPQIDYFEAVAERMAAGPEAADEPPRVVLVTGQPSWVYCADEAPRPSGVDPSSGPFDELAFFEEHLIRRRGLRLAAVVSGDLHHYCRYEQEDPGPAPPTQRVTCGGGGAYLGATHTLPPRLALEEGDGKEVRRVRYALRRRFPDEATSRRLSWRVLALPWRNPGLALMIGGLYLVFAWILESASFSDALPGTLSSRLHPGADPRAAAVALATVVLHSPASLLFALAVAYGVFAFTRAQRQGTGRGTTALGALHALAHLALALALFGALGYLVEAAGLGLLRRSAVIVGAMLVAGALLGGWLLALHLLVASRLTGAHTNEVFAAQRRGDHKAFLRFHLAADGTLTIYPIGLAEVPARWEVVPEGAPGDAWFRPVQGELAPHLIEEPVVLPGPPAAARRS